MKYFESHWCIYIMLSIIISCCSWFQGCIVSDVNNKDALAKVFKFHFTQTQFISLGFNMLITFLWYLNTIYLYSK